MLKGIVPRGFCSPIFLIKLLHLRPSFIGKIIWQRNLFVQLLIFFCSLPFCDTTQRHFSYWRIQQRRSSFAVSLYGGDFFLLWDTMEDIFLLCRIQPKNTFWMSDNFLLLYPTPQVFLVLYPLVSHTSKESSLLYPTTQKIPIQCGMPQKKIILSRNDIFKFLVPLIAFRWNPRQNRLL